MKTSAVFAILLFLTPALAGEIQIKLHSSVDSSKFNIEAWKPALEKLRQMVTPKNDHKVIEIRVDPTLYMGATGDCRTGVITLKYQPVYTSGSKTIVRYRTLTHEAAHIFNPQCAENGTLADVTFEEARATVLTELVYRELSPESNPTWDNFFTTSVYNQDVMRNLSPLAIAGASYWRDNLIAGSYQIFSGTLEHLISALPERDFRAIDQTIIDAQPKNEAELLAAVDQAVGRKINGVLPSTYLSRNPATFLNGPDGTFLSIYPEGTALNGFAFAPVNPSALKAYIIKRQDGKNWMIAGRLRYSIKDAFGRERVSGEDEIKGNVVIINTKGLPTGAYAVSGCVVEPSGNCGSVQDTGYPLIRYPEPWDRDMMFIIANGRDGQWGLLDPVPNLDLVDADPRLEVEKYPGLLAIRLNGSTDDVRVTDGTAVKTFTPHPEFSTIFVWQRRFENQEPKISAIQSATGVEQEPYSAREIVTLWGERLPGGYYTAGSEGIAPELGGVQVRVCGYPAGLMMLNAPQLNLVLPRDLNRQSCLVSVTARQPDGLTLTSGFVNIQLTDSPTPRPFRILSISPRYPIITDPSYRIVGPPDDPNFVPARPGGVYTAWATACGPASDGTHLDNLPVIKIGGVPAEIEYAGYHPAFEGLCQINFRISPGVTPRSSAPEGLASGTYFWFGENPGKNWLWLVLEDNN